MFDQIAARSALTASASRSKRNRAWSRSWRIYWGGTKLDRSMPCSVRSASQTASILSVFGRPGIDVIDLMTGNWSPRTWSMRSNERKPIEMTYLRSW